MPRKGAGQRARKNPSIGSFSDVLKETYCPRLNVLGHRKCDYVNSSLGLNPLVIHCNEFYFGKINNAE